MSFRLNNLDRRRPENQDELFADLRRYLDSRQKRSDKIRNFFEGKSVQYAAA